MKKLVKSKLNQNQLGLCFSLKTYIAKLTRFYMSLISQPVHEKLNNHISTFLQNSFAKMFLHHFACLEIITGQYQRIQ